MNMHLFSAGLAALLALTCCPGKAADDQHVYLVCTGWMPVYSDWSKGADNPRARTDATSLTVTLDRRAKRMSFMLPYIGKTTLILDESESEYSGIIKYNAPPQAGNGAISAVTMHINRLTGEGTALYEVNGKIFIAYSGECAQKTRKF